jgi:signal peptide peptidase SppA
MKLLDIMTAPWALTPSKFTEVQELYLRHVRGQSLSSDALEQLRAAAVIKLKPKTDQPDPYQNMNGVAVVDIAGVISKKMNLFSDISGGVSTQLIGRAVNQALQDPSVRAILLNIDSPGGAVDGTQELAKQIFAARAQKPIVAYTDGMMASAAYWIGAAAEQIYISGDTTEVGSIGVVATHVDVSKFQEASGIKTTEIVAGKFKRVASSYAPLSDMGRATIQEQVDHVYSVFVQDVATFRGVSPETVVKDMADGRIFIGRQAIEHGLVNGQRSLDALITELSTRRIQGGRMNGTAPESTATISQMDHDTALAEARQDGRAEGLDAGKADGVKLGIEQERARIKAIDDLDLKGSSDLIAAAKYTTPITAEQLSMQVVKSDKDMRARMQQEFHAQAPQAVPHANATVEPEPVLNAEELSVAIQGKVDEAAKNGRRLSYTDAKNQVMSERARIKI